MTQYTLDSTVLSIVNDPNCDPLDFCRTTIRLRSVWGDDTLREFLSRPPQRAIVDALRHVELWVWEKCDAELQTAIATYLEQANG